MESLAEFGRFHLIIVGAEFYLLGMMIESAELEIMTFDIFHRNGHLVSWCARRTVDFDGQAALTKVSYSHVMYMKTYALDDYYIAVAGRPYFMTK
jgi:hypothetical protein